MGNAIVTAISAWIDDVVDYFDSHGVGARVLEEVKALRNWTSDPNGRQQLRLHVDGWPHDRPHGPTVTEQDAKYIVKALRRALLQNGSSSSSSTRDIVLELGVPLAFSTASFSDEAIGIFCEYLRENSLSSLSVLSLPQHQFRRLLEALYTNMSIKNLELGIEVDYDDDPIGDHVGEYIADLLRHKTDLVMLDIECFDRFRLSSLLPGLRRSHPNLKSLLLSHCHVDDEHVRLILETIREGDFPVLEHIDLSRNHITSIGLHTLAELLPTVVPRLQWLRLESDDTMRREMLQNEATTRFFATRLLTSKEMSVKELCLEQFYENVTPIVEACESNLAPIVEACESQHCKLDVLNVAFSSVRLYYPTVHFQSLIDQLIRSLPNIKTLTYLDCRGVVSHFFVGNNLSLIMDALYRNTSIVDLLVCDLDDDYDDFHTQRAAQAHRLVAPILLRNVYLAHLDGLLRPSAATPIAPMASTLPITAAADDAATTTTTPAPTNVPTSLWPRVLAKVGGGGQNEETTISLDSTASPNHLRATPVFKVLQDRLATWTDATNAKKSSGNKSMKHQEEGHEASTSSAVVVAQASSTE